jgi:hypothetical protein
MRVQDKLATNTVLSVEARVQELQHLLAEVRSVARHPDYDWPICLQREVDEALPRAAT